MRKYLYLIVALASFFIIFGCTTRKTPEQFISKALPEPEKVLQSLHHDESVEKTLKAVAKVILNSSKGKLSRRVGIAVKRPSYLRIDAIPIFGPPDFFLSVKNKSFKVFLPQQEDFFIGSATRENLFQFFNLYLTIDETTSILMGVPPVISTPDSLMKARWDGTLYHIDILSCSKKVQSIWINIDQNSVVKTEVFSRDGQLLYSAFFEDFASVEEQYYPHTLKIIMKKPQKMSFTIEYSDIQISEKGNTSLFDLSIPAGMTPTFID